MQSPLPTIYFVQTDPPDGPVKIGYTGRRVQTRLAEGQTFAQDEILLLVETPGNLSDEARLHRIFKDYHHRGEWYRYELPVRELVGYLSEGGSLRSWFDANG